MDHATRFCAQARLNRRQLSLLARYHPQPIAALNTCLRHGWALSPRIARLHTKLCAAVATAPRVPRVFVTYATTLPMPLREGTTLGLPGFLWCSSAAPPAEGMVWVITVPADGARILCLCQALVLRSPTLRVTRVAADVVHATLVVPPVYVDNDDV